MDTLVIEKLLNVAEPTVDDSGREPVSGVKGKGTATEPYDAGNEDSSGLARNAAPQTYSNEESPAPDEVTEANVFFAKPDLSTTANGGVSSYTNPSPELVEQPTTRGSGWSTNTNPFSQRDGMADKVNREELDPKETMKTDAKGTFDTVENASSPPNHLGKDVPAGLHTVVVDPRDSIADPVYYSGNSDRPYSFGSDSQWTPPMDKGKGKAKMTEADFADYESSSAASNRSSGMRSESVATDYTITSKNTYSTVGTGASTIASSSRRHSAALLAPHSQGKALTAGGIPLGQRAMQEREMRLASTIPDRYWGRIDDITSSTYGGSANGASGSGLSLSQHQDFASPTPRALASSPQPNEFFSKPSSTTPIDSRTTAPAESKEGPRRSSVMQKAKGFGRKFSIRMKPSK